MLQESIAKVVELFNSNQLDKTAQLYASNGRMVSENGSVYEGTEQISAALGRKNAENRGTKADVVGSPMLRTVTPDVSVVELSFKRLGEAGNMPAQGKIVAVAKRNGDDWRIDSSWVIPQS